MTEAAKFSGLSTDTLYKAMRTKPPELRYVKKGRRRVIPKVGLIDWMAEDVNAD